MSCAVSQIIYTSRLRRTFAVRPPKRHKAGETGVRFENNNHFSIACGETARIAFLPSWDPVGKWLFPAKRRMLYLQCGSRRFLQVQLSSTSINSSIVMHLKQNLMLGIAGAFLYVWNGLELRSQSRS